MLTHFMIIDHLCVEKMYYGFTLIAWKLPLQKWWEAKEIFLVPTLSPISDHWA